MSDIGGNSVNLDLDLFETAERSGGGSPLSAMDVSLPGRTPGVSVPVDNSSRARTTAAMAASALTTAFSAYSQGRMNSQMADHNAVMAEYDKRAILMASHAEEQALRKKGKQVKGDAEVAAAASGFTTDSGSSADALRDIDIAIEEGAAAIRVNALLATGAVDQEQILARLQGQQAELASNMEVATTVLSGAKSISEIYG